MCVLLQSEKPEELMEGGPDDGNEAKGREADKDKDRQQQDGAKEEGCGEEKEYEFTSWEERVLEVRTTS